MNYDWVEIDENGYVKSIYLDSPTAPETGSFIKVEDDPMQYIGKQYVDGVFIDVEIEVINEPSQLDIIQEAVEKSNEELRQEGSDALLAEMIADGLI